MNLSSLSPDILSRVAIADNGCWLWTGALNAKGYGRFRRRGMHLAHRAVYELLVGPIPAGLELDHLCRVHRCVNPAHLEPVTRRENILRGVSISAQRAAQTHCIHGHNRWSVYSDGTRRCLECHRLRQIARYRRTRTA